MALPVTDTFNRADGSIGANWTVINGALNVNGNAAAGGATPGVDSDGFGYWNADVFNGNHISTGTFESFSASGHVYLFVRVSGTSLANMNSYYFYLDYSGVLLIGKQVSGSATNLITTTGTATAGDVFELSANGSSIVLKQNGSTIQSTTDGSVTGGAPGIGLYTTGDKWSTWTGDNIAAGGGSGTQPVTLLGCG